MTCILLIIITIIVAIINIILALCALFEFGVGDAVRGTRPDRVGFPFSLKIRFFFFFGSGIAALYSQHTEHTAKLRANYATQRRSHSLAHSFVCGDDVRQSREIKNCVISVLCIILLYLYIYIMMCLVVC